MKRLRLLLTSLFVSVAVAQTAADKITAGRAALAAHDLLTAQARFQEALDLNPTAQTAAALLGLTRCANVVTWTASQNFLSHLGVSSTGRNVYRWDTTFTRDAGGEIVLPANFNFTEAADLWLGTLIPQSEQARASIAIVTNTTFLLTLSAAETGLPVTTNVDYGDLIMTRSWLRAAEFLGHFSSSQNLNANLGALRQLANGDMLTLQRVLLDNPDFMKPGALAERTAARAALLEAIALYREASAFIRARPAGLNRLFTIDDGQLPAEADFRALLDKIERAVTEPVALGSSGNYGTLGPVFAADWSLRGALPSFTATGFDFTTIVDGTLGGILAGTTREQIAQALVSDPDTVPELGWEWVSPKPQGNALTRYLALTGGKHVAVGEAGTVLTSDNGTTWVTRRIPGAGVLTGLATGLDKVVAVAPGRIYLSADAGVTWRRVFNEDGEFRGVAFGGGRFVVLGSWGTCLISVDGETWNYGYAGSFTGREVVYTGSLFLAVGVDPNQSRAAIATSADGLSWTTRFTAAATGTAFTGVAAGSGKFVAVGWGNQRAVSTDALAWTAGTVLASGSTNFYGIGFRNNLFVAAGDGATLATSPDGATWTSVASGETTYLSSVGAGTDAIYVTGGGGVVLRSTDGVAFARVQPSQAATDLGATLLGLRAIDSQLYVVGTAGTILRSSDGQAFSPVTSGTTNALWSLLKQGTTIYAVGNAGTILASADGTTWTARTSGTTANLRTLAYLNGQFVAAGFAGALLTSPDGVTWTSRTTGVSGALYGVAYGNGTYVAVGGNISNLCHVLTSTDGATWTTRTINTTFTLRGLVFDQGVFTAVGSNGVIARSTDGVMWTVSFANNSGNLVGLRVLDGRYYTTQDGFDFYGNEVGQIAMMVSSDGEHWVRVPQGTGNPQYGAELFQGRVYTVGNSATILRTAPLPALTVAALRVLTPDKFVRQGDQLVLAVAANGAGTLAYQWKKNGVAISGATGAGLELANIQVADAGSYTLTVTNAAGSATSAAIALTVDATPVAPVFALQPLSQIVNIGLPVTFNVTATGTTPIAYQWRKDGVALADATTATLTPASVQPTHAGSYTVVVSNIAGSLTSAVATLSVTGGGTSTVASVAAGESYTMFVKTDGTLWVAGQNGYGQLGDGAATDRSTPVQVASGVASVAGGSQHTMFVKTDGTLWATGRNVEGQLGNGTTTTRSTPVQVATGLVSVAAGYQHTMFVKTDGTLWAAGWNSYGQLGDGTATNRSTPVQVASGVASVAAGYEHTMFVKTDGTLWAVGSNGYGELGDGTKTDRSTPVQVASGVASVAAGFWFTMFVKTDGTLWAVGWNGYGQLGDGTSTDRSTPVQIGTGVASVAAGDVGLHTTFVKTDGTLWAVGRNDHGQLGDGTTTNRSTPVQAASGVASVAVGGRHTMFVKTDGTLWAVGSNGPGQLGDGTTTDRSTPVQVAGPTGPAVTTASGTSAFTEGNNVPSTPVAVDSALTVASGTATLASGTVSITANFQSAQDVLAFSNTGASMGNITAGYNSGTGVLTLTSSGATATVAQWQSTLRAVTYTNSSDSPHTANRTISFVVNDGTSNSAAATKTVSVTTVNDTPTDIILSASTVNQSAGTNATVGTLSTADLDSVSFTYTLVSGTGSTDNASFNISGATLRANNPAALAVGTYSVRIQADDGSAGSFAKAFTLTVTAAPVAPAITTQPVNVTVNAGENASFTVAATGSPAPTYQWRKGGTNLSGATSPALMLNSVQTADAANYDVVVTNAAGSVTSNVAALTVNPATAAPAITTHPASQTVAVGANVTFSVAATGTPAPTYQWKKAGVDISGATSASLTLANVQYADAGSYTVVVTNSVGAVTSSAVALAVVPPTLSSIAVTPATPTMAVGATQQLVATGTFNNGTTRTLTSGGNTWASGASLASASYGLGAAFVGGKVYAISGFATTRVAAYDTAANTWANVASLPQLLQYFGTAVLNGKIYVVGGDTGGGGDRATLYCYDPVANTWTSLAAMPGGSRYNLGAVALNGKIYAIGGYHIGTSSYLSRVEVYDPVANTWATGTALPAVRAAAAMGAINGKIYVAGGSDTAGALTSGVVFDPATNAWTAIAAMPVAQNFNAAVVDGKLITIGGGPSPEKLVQAYDAVANTWATLALMPSGRRDLGVAFDDVGRKIYALGGYNTGYSSALEIFTPPGEVTWTSATPAVATISATGLATSVAVGTSSITATVGAVVGSTVLTVSGNAAPAITTQPVAQTVNAGQPATFTIVASGTPSPSLQWQGSPAGTTGFGNIFSGGSYSGTTTATLTVSSTAAMSGDRFRCVASNSAGPDAISAPAMLTVNVASAITSASSTTFTVGQSGSHTVTATGTPTPTFSATGLPTWLTLNATTGVLSGTPPNTSGAPLSLSLTASNGVAPNATQNFTLNVLPAPQAPSITTQPAGQTVNAGDSVTFTVFATGTAPLSYQWRKAGVARSGATNTSLTFTNAQPSDSGTYDVVVSNGVNPNATANAAMLNVVPSGVSATHSLASTLLNASGGTITISNRSYYFGPVTNLQWSVPLPAGWSFAVSDAASASVKPTVGTIDLIEWSWTTLSASPVAFTYTLNVPVGDVAPRSLAALVDFKHDGTSIRVTAKPDPLVVGFCHSADTDRDFHISLFELTRVIELYNTRNGTVRTGCYRLDAANLEDGFAADSVRASGASVALARHHSADTRGATTGSPRDGAIDLFELTRVIELYNTRAGTVRTGQYHVQTGTEDGFAAGP